MAFQKGYIPWNKGTHVAPPFAFKKGCIPWNKGIKTGIIPRSVFVKGHSPTAGCFKKGHYGGVRFGEGQKGHTIPHTNTVKALLSALWQERIKKGIMVGENNPNWKGGISRAYKTGYYSMEYKKWRKGCMERDDFTCQRCGEKGYLTVHHIKSFAKYPKLRFELTNGITLCENCHSKVDKYRARFKLSYA